MPANEQKPKWIAKGDKREDAFRDLIAPQLGWQLTDGVKYGVDFYDANGAEIELKYRDAPFYMAQKMLSMEPSFTVPLNCSNLKRYSPVTQIVFWVDWPAANKYGVHVEAAHGLWSILAGEVDTTSDQRHHFYANRLPHVCGGRDEFGNNVCSRYLDLREMKRLDTPDMVWA